MSDLEFSDALKELSQGYSSRQITLQQYRQQRKLILMQIDEKYNGFKQSGLPKAKRKAKRSMIKKAAAFLKK